MKIGEIDILDSEVEKLARSQKRVLYCLYEAYQDGGGVTTWTLNRAGGSGFSERVKEVRAFLDKYKVTIRNREYMRREGRNIWAYWLAPSDMIPVMPRKVFGDV